MNFKLSRLDTDVHMCHLQVSRWQGGNISEHASKKLISLFSFPCHVAPGEAEAECAMLQSRGIVDAVMTQDVDAIMFGAGLTLRDWSKEGKAGSHSAPTHVSVFDLEKLKEISGGLDPEGMVLVALLSGGDYDEDGVPGIGISLACEIARAGFGSDLLELVRRSDEGGIQEWRDRLQYELEANESGYFKMKRKTVRIPVDFPNRKILDYYMNPAVTQESELAKLESKWKRVWAEEIDIQMLREYTAATFDWGYKPGAWHFVRNLAPALIAHQLQRGSAASIITSEVQITERRRHFVSDGIPELRVTVVPAEVVGLDLDAEEDSPQYLESLAAIEEGIKDAGVEQEAAEDIPPGPAKQRKKSPWVPWNPEKMWIPESLFELGAREHLERWNQIQWEIENDAKKFATRKTKSKFQGGMRTGAMEKYTVAAKPFSKPVEATKTSSNAAASLMVDKAPALTEDYLLSLPTPPKAIRKAQRRMETRTQSKSAQADLQSLPSMPGHFKTMKESEGAERLRKRVPLDAYPLTVSNRLEKDHSSSLTPAPNVLLSTATTSTSEPEKMLQNVTRRSPKRRANGGRNSVDSEPPSPVRPKRPIEDFFKPWLKPKEPPVPSAGLTNIPPELTTGLKTILELDKHMHAIPRSSLPGTWKEAECNSTASSQVVASQASRPPRISIVDLTID
jgi:holliday junction resolvase YEN1